MKEIDITLPVLIDRATQELRATIEILQNETGITDSLMECALERVLLEMRSNRTTVYGTTLFHMSQENKGTLDVEKGEHDGRHNERD